MTISEIGLVIGLVGALILAFSLRRVLGALILACTALDLTVETLCGREDIVQVAGLDRHLDRGMRSAKARTMIGTVFLAAGYGLQLADSVIQRL